MAAKIHNAILRCSGKLKTRSLGARSPRIDQDHPELPEAQFAARKGNSTGCQGPRSPRQEDPILGRQGIGKWEAFLTFSSRNSVTQLLQFCRPITLGQFIPFRLLHSMLLST